MTDQRTTILTGDDRLGGPLATRIATAGRAAYARSGCFRLAISAAALDASLVTALATPPIRDEAFWRGTRLFLADNWVRGRPAPWPPLRAAVARLPLPPGAAHLAMAESENAVAAANAYEQELRATFSLQTGALPRLDLCVLAANRDGRIGGLLRGSRALDEIDRLVVAEFVPAARCSVVTLTAPVIQNAALTLVIAPAAFAQSPPCAVRGAAAPDAGPV